MNKINIFLIKLEIIFFITFNNSITKMFSKVKGENQIKYIEIKKSYTENKPRNHRYTTIDNYVNMIKNKNEKTSIYEIFAPNKNVKIYFDIEKIPFDEPKLIDDIIGDLRLFFSKTTNLELGEYIKTINEHSANHKGLSYHLIFYEYHTSVINILCFLNEFLTEYPQYVKYMDGSVYSDDRLFKSINQIGVHGKYIDTNPENYHRIANVEQNDLTIKQSIIQYIDESKELMYKFKEVKRPKYKKMSGGAKKESRIVINNYIDKDKVSTGIFKQQPQIKIDDEIYSLMFALSMNDKLNKIQKKYIKELMKHYDKHKSFDGYKQTKIQILSILKIIKE